MLKLKTSASKVSLQAIRKFRRCLSSIPSKYVYFVELRNNYVPLTLIFYPISLFLFSFNFWIRSTSICFFSFFYHHQSKYIIFQTYAPIPLPREIIFHFASWHVSTAFGLCIFFTWVTSVKIWVKINIIKW